MPSDNRADDPRGEANEPGLLELSRQLGFTTVDLASNRQGQLSPAQHARFVAGAEAVQRSSSTAQVITMGLSAVVCAYLMVGGLAQLGDAKELPLVAHLLPLSVGVAVGYWLKRSPGEPLPPVSSVALCAEGRVKWSYEEGSGWGANSAYVFLDDVRLSVTISQQKALAQGLRYRVYYTTAYERIAGQTPHTILSAEPAGL